MKRFSILSLVPSLAKRGRVRVGASNVRQHKPLFAWNRPFIFSLAVIASFGWLLNTSAALAQTPDTQAPTVPGALIVTAATSTSVRLTWVASTDNVGVTAYLVERCQGAGCTNFAQVTSVTTTTYNNTGRTVRTSYSYRVRARDAANNKSGYSNVVTVVTPDTTVPTKPGTVTLSVVSSSQINLSWVASTDNVAVTGYRLERCAGSSCTNYAQFAIVIGTTYNNTGLAASTTYRYRLRAQDAAGNVSTYSTIVSASTLAPDAQAPTAPTSLSGAAQSSTQINLSWTASTDNVGVTAYRLERCQGLGCGNFAQIASIATTTYNDVSLTPGASYAYRVRATDAANNLSAYSNTSIVTTQYAGPITFSYTYDQLGRLTHAAGSDGSSVDYQHDANGNVTTIGRQ